MSGFFNPPFMQNRTGYGLERLLLCQTNKSENKKNNLQINPKAYSNQDKIHIEKYNMLNDDGKAKLNERLDELLELPKYRK